eukprot:scaffold577919_cov42-Prasinocladus_malaysianus.AAC.1
MSVVAYAWLVSVLTHTATDCFGRLTDCTGAQCRPQHVRLPGGDLQEGEADAGLRWQRPPGAHHRCSPGAEQDVVWTSGGLPASAPLTAIVEQLCSWQLLGQQ